MQNLIMYKSNALNLEELQDMQRESDNLHKVNRRIDLNMIKINRDRINLASKLQDLHGKDYL
jgi:hypothetical protein